MTSEDDDDVDSGWDAPPAPLKAAPPPAAPPPALTAPQVLPVRPQPLTSLKPALAPQSVPAKDAKAAKDSSALEEAEPTSATPTIRPGPLSTAPASVPRPPPTRRVDVPLMRQSLSKAVIFESDDDEAPLTRRAEDQELAKAKARSSEPAVPVPVIEAEPLDSLEPLEKKKPSRKVTPVQGNAAQVAKRLDARVHSRPTPPARPIAPMPIAQSSALRFPSDGLDRVRLRGRAATKVNISVAELAKASLFEESRKGSVPALDLHLDGPDSPLPDSLDLPVGDGVAASDVLSDVPVDFVPELGDLDDLPVSEMIESARPSSVARRSAFPISFAQALASSESAGDVSEDAPRPSDEFDEFSISGRLTMPVALVEAEVSYGDEVGLSEEEERALQEELDDSDGAPHRPLVAEIHDDPLAVTAEAPAGTALNAYLNLSASELENSAELVAQLEGLRARFDKGDFMGVLMRAEGLLESHPDCAPARSLVSRAEERLRDTYKARLGSGSEVLRVMLRPEEVQGLSLDHRAGFLMSLCDGVSTIDEVVDMSGMSELDVLRLLFEMREQGVVAVAGD